MLVIVLVVVAVALLFVLIHKRPVVENVGLADPKSWAAPQPPSVPPADGVMIPPPAPPAEPPQQHV